MTVKELITYLETLPEETRVFEERQSELRELNVEDIGFDLTAIGHSIDEGDYFPFAEYEEILRSPIVIFRAWK